MINGLFGSGNHKFELGGGIDVVAASFEGSVNDTEINSGVLLTATITGNQFWGQYLMIF